MAFMWTCCLGNTQYWCDFILVPTNTHSPSVVPPPLHLFKAGQRMTNQPRHWHSGGDLSLVNRMEITPSWFVSSIQNLSLQRHCINILMVPWFSDMYHGVFFKGQLHIFITCFYLNWLTNEEHRKQVQCKYHKYCYHLVPHNNRPKCQSTATVFFLSSQIFSSQWLCYDWNFNIWADLKCSRASTRAKTSIVHSLKNQVWLFALKSIVTTLATPYLNVKQFRVTQQARIHIHILIWNTLCSILSSWSFIFVYKQLNNNRESILKAQFTQK